MEYQTLTAAELRPLVLMWQKLREQGWELNSSVRHVFNWKKFRFEYRLRIYRNDERELNEERTSEAL
jgi:hypothetical protein